MKLVERFFFFFFLLDAVEGMRQSGDFSKGLTRQCYCYTT